MKSKAGKEVRSTLRHGYRSSVTLSPNLFMAIGLIFTLGTLAARPAPVTVGNVTSVTVTTNGVTGNRTASFALSTGGSVEITPFAPNVVRVDFHWIGPFETEQIMIAKPFTNWPSVSETFTDNGATYVIATPELDVEIQKTPLKIHFKDKSGFFLLQEDHMEFDSAYNYTAQSGSGSSKLYCQKVMPTNQAYFGLGEYGGPLNRRGRTLECWNIGTYNWSELQNPTYLNIPFFYGVQPAGGGNPAFVYGVFFHNPCRPKFKFGTQFSDKYSYEAGDGRMDYFFMGGGTNHTMARVIDRYSELTGRPTMLPKWGLGYHLSRFSYDNQSWVEYIANAATTNDIPLDAVYLDIDYMDANHDGNIADGQLHQLTMNSNFSNPAGMINYCSARGVKVVPLIEPWLEPGDSFYGEADGLAHFIKDNAANTVTRSIYVGNVSWFDYSSTPMQTWWTGKTTNWFKNVGFSGIWNDLTEPEGGDQIPYDGLLWCDGRYGLSTTDSRRQWSNEHNHFGLRSSQQSYNTMLAKDPNKRPFVLSRSGNAGLQRYAISWSGDTRANWFYQRATIRFGMGAMIAGAAWYGNDVGGFAGTPTDELLVRSHEWNALTPFFREHADKGGSDREPWRPGWSTGLLREIIKFRYKLMPYLYTLAYESTQNGRPMNVPLVFDYNNDVNTAAELTDYEFLVGPYILAAPIYTEGATSRSVYLPFAPGVEWYYWPNGQKYSGGQQPSVNAPLGTLPMFIRSGAIIPMGPSMQYANQFQSPYLDINCWPNGSSEFTLHEDDGETWDFLSGEYARTRLVSSRTANAWDFNIEARLGSYNPGVRDYYVYCYNPPTTAVQAVTLNDVALSQVADFSSVTQAWHFTPEGRIAIKLHDTGAASAIHVGWVPTNNALQLSAANYSVAETAGTVRIYVNRIGDTNGAVSVNFATTGGSATAGSDYATTNGTLNWAGGDAADKFFDVSIADDAVHEDDEVFTVNLSGGSGASLGSPAQATVTITDDDPPPGTVQFVASLYPVAETGGTVRIFVSRVQGSSGVASVTFATSNGTAAAGFDYIATNATLNWADGDGSDRYVDVFITDDANHEGDETFGAELMGAAGASLGGPSSATVTIVDNELPPGTLQFLDPAHTAAETSGSVRIYVSRTGGSGGAASVYYATADGSASAGLDYIASNSTLNWADGDASNKFFDVAIVSDEAYELAETFTIGLSGAGGATLGSPTSTTVTITEPPLPELLITNPPVDIGVGQGITNYDLQGVANPSNWLGLVWSNSLTGNSGQAPIDFWWTISGIALDVGTNVITVTATNVGAGANAADSGTNTAYNTGWTNGANGGVGWAGGWIITNSANSGVFIAGAANVNNSAGTRAWGMWANSSTISDARRTFASAMVPGQEFSLRLDNNYIQNGGSVGFGLQNAAGNNLFEFFFVGGGANYSINDKLTNRNTGIGYSSDGWDITFRLTNNTQYRFTCGANVLSGTLNSNVDENLVRFRAFNYNGGNGENFDFFFNNIALTGGAGGPGPSTSDVVQIIRSASDIPQSWRDRYNLTGANSGDSEDKDGDGLSNQEEYWSDTNPTNPASYFGWVMMESTGTVDKGITITVPAPTTNSRLYDLSYGSNLMDGFWWPFGFNLPGQNDGGSLTFTITNKVDPELFYRTRVILP